MQWAKIKIRFPGDCKEPDGGPEQIINIYEKEVFCAGNEASKFQTKANIKFNFHKPFLVPSTSPCYGDSGGPLICVINKTAVLTGIVSFGKVGCAVGFLPTVFTKVFGFLHWILQFTVSFL